MSSSKREFGKGRAGENVGAKWENAGTKRENAGAKREFGTVAHQSPFVVDLGQILETLVCHLLDVVCEFFRVYFRIPVLDDFLVRCWCRKDVKSPV